MDDSLPLAAASNLGPASARMLERAGTRTCGELRQLGAVAAHARVKAAGARPSLNLLWVLEAALCGLHWQDVARDHRTSLLLALDEYESRRR